MNMVPFSYNPFLRYVCNQFLVSVRIISSQIRRYKISRERSTIGLPLIRGHSLLHQVYFSTNEKTWIVDKKEIREAFFCVMGKHGLEKRNSTNDPIENDKEYSVENKDKEIPDLFETILSENTKNKIYVNTNFCDTICSLCKEKDSKGIIANLMYFILNYVNSKHVSTIEEYKETIRKVYFHLMKCYHILFRTSTNENGEYVFSIFNESVLKVVSPTLKKNKKNLIHNMILSSLQFYFKNHEKKKNALNINRMCEVIQYEKFLDVLEHIGYELELLKDHLSIQNLNYLLRNFLKNRIYLSKSIELVSIFHIQCDHLYSPFQIHQEDSSFSCKDILITIIKVESKKCLFLFLDSLKKDQLRKEAFSFLISHNPYTGLLNSSWACAQAIEYTLLNETKEEEKEERNDHAFIEDENIEKRNVTKEVQKNSTFFILPEDVSVKIIKNQMEDLQKLLKTVQRAQEQHWKENIYNTNMESECINEFTDSKREECSNDHITADYIMDELKKYNKNFSLGIYVQRNKSKQLHFLILSTYQEVYLLDVYNVDYTFKVALFYFLQWVLENPFIHKIFFNFPYIMHTLSLFFQNVSCFSVYSNVSDLKSPLTEKSKIVDDSKEENMDLLESEWKCRKVLDESDIHLFTHVLCKTKGRSNKPIVKSEFDSNLVIPLCDKKDKTLYFKSVKSLCDYFLNKKLATLLYWDDREITSLSKEEIHYLSSYAYILLRIEEQLMNRNCYSKSISNKRNVMEAFLLLYKKKKYTWDLSFHMPF